jgi:hypothetical protein
MDGLTVSTDSYRQLLLTFPDSFTSKLQLGFSNFYLQGSGTTDELTIANNSSGQTKFINQSKTSMLIDNSGDISFYEDTGTTPKFFWDASAESLGVGTVSPARTLHLAANTNCEIRLEAVGQRHYAIASNSSNAFVVNDVTAGAERLRIDSSGNLLVGTTSFPSGSTTGFGFQGSSDYAYFARSGGESLNLDRHTSDGDIAVFRKDGTTVGSIGARVGDLYLGTGDVGITFTDSIDSIRPVDPSTTDLRDAAIDIGTGTARFKDLYLSGDIVINDQTNGATRKILFDMRNTGGAQSDFSLQANNGNFLFYSEAAATERARIDSSGNLLVGKTSDNNAVAGTTISNSGIVKATRTDWSLLLNRLTTDGDIALFQKDGTTVGSIGVWNNDNISLYGNSSHAGIGMATNSVEPIRNNAPADNSVDLGVVSARFKDLYLGGGVYLGGTGAANHLDDYEEGLWTPTLSGGTSAGTTTYNGRSGDYTKMLMAVLF